MLKHVIGLDVGPHFPSVQVAVPLDGGRRIVDCCVGWFGRVRYRLERQGVGFVGDFAAFAPVQRAHGHVVVLLFGRDVVRAAGDLGTTATVPVNGCSYGQHDAGQTAADGSSDDGAETGSGCRSGAVQRRHGQCVVWNFF